MLSKNQEINKLREWNSKLEDAVIILTDMYEGVIGELETVREFVLSRRDDIERDIENFGMLRPVLSYFLKEAERARNL